MSKILDETNFLEIDSRMEGQTVYGLGPMSHPPEAWTRLFTSVRLDNGIPAEICEMFDRSRGAMCYGTYYYPLYTLGMEESFRLMESALRHAYAAVSANAEDTSMNFADLIKWAAKAGLLSESERHRWTACRYLRNSASHKKKESVYSPVMALSHLDSSKELLEALFRRVATVQRRENPHN